jgi:NADH:ubiquinone oxidoreductase subunit 5 (subunit L)/multisubunit Na+/H+ antiporter MnhA subunit
MIEGLNYSNVGFSMLFIVSMAVLAISGGISIFTFTKNFGMIFLGNTRKKMEHQPKEVSWAMLLPQFIIIGVMLSIAFFPSFYISLVSDSANRLSTIYNVSNNTPAITPHILSNVAFCSACFILIIGLIYTIRQALTSKLPKTTFETWGCGYTGPAKATQYTGRSFSETLGNLLPFIPRQKQSEPKENKRIFILKLNFSIRYNDIFNTYIIDPLINVINRTISLFRFIQNGQVQFYLLYGIVFLLIILLGTFWHVIK